MSQIDYLLALISDLEKYLDTDPKSDPDYNLCWDLLIDARDDLSKLQ